MQKSNELDIRKYLESVNRYKWHGLIPAFVMTLILIYASSHLPEVYESTCIVEVNTGAIENPLRPERERPTNLHEHLALFAQTAGSWSILSGVIEELGADTIAENSDVYNIRKILKGLARLRNPSGTSQQETSSTPKQNPARDERIARILQGGLIFGPRPPKFITISYKGVNPDVTADILNTLVSRLIEEQTASQLNRAGRSYEFVKVEMESYKIKLEEAEVQLKDFKEKHITELPDQMNSTMTHLTNDNSEILALELELKEHAITSEYLDRQIEDQEELVVSEIRTEANPLLGVLNERIIDMEIELTRLRTNYTELHPRVGELRGQLEDLKKQKEGLQESTVNSETSMLNPVYQQLIQNRQATLVRTEVIRNRIVELEKRIAENEKKIQGMPAQEQKLLTLNRNYDVTANIYDMFLQKLEEVRLQEKLATEEKNKQSFHVFEYARAKVTPVAPNKILTVMFIMMLGAGTCAGIILLFDFFDDSFKTVHEVKEFLGKPMLGSLPTLKSENGNGSLSKWIKKSSEAIRKS